jgi:energy-coupling factor transporter transmembrane protein EcfT
MENFYKLAIIAALISIALFLGALQVWLSFQIFKLILPIFIVIISISVIVAVVALITSKVKKVEEIKPIKPRTITEAKSNDEIEARRILAMILAGIIIVFIVVCSIN